MANWLDRGFPRVMAAILTGGASEALLKVKRNREEKYNQDLVSAQVGLANNIAIQKAKIKKEQDDALAAAELKKQQAILDSQKVEEQAKKDDTVFYIVIGFVILIVIYKLVLKK